MKKEYTEEQYFFMPLSKDDELYYLQLKEKGDLIARDILIKHNLRLVASIAKKFVSSGIEIDELISIGTIGLIKAIDTYESTKGAQLATYAYHCIDNEILMYLRSDKKHFANVHLEDIITIDPEGNILILGEIIDAGIDITSNFEQETERKIFLEQFNKLNASSKQILFLRYIREMTQKRVAQEIGMSQSNVCRIECKSIEKLKKEIKQLMKD